MLINVAFVQYQVVLPFIFNKQDVIYSPTLFE